MTSSEDTPLLRASNGQNAETINNHRQQQPQQHASIFSSISSTTSDDSTKKTIRSLLYKHQDSFSALSSELMARFTKSERTRALMKEGIGPAAFLLRDAVLGNESENPAEGSYDPYSPDGADANEFRNSVSIICHRLCSYRPLVTLLHAVCWILVILTYIEPPEWCRPDDDESPGCRVLLNARGVPASSSNSTAAKDQDEVDYYPNSHSMMLNVKQSRAIEATCLAIIFLFVILRIGRDGMSLTRYLRRGTSQTNRCIKLLSMLLLLLGLISGQTVHHAYVRLALLISLNEFGAQRELLVLVRIVPRIMRILALLFVLIVFYGWFGTVMFLGTEEGLTLFPSLDEAMWTMWICVTTANYPDVMMAAYNENRWVALYFVSFMIISFFFLMNIILASVVNDYDTVVTERREKNEREAQECLRKAYKLLDPHDTGRIDRETVMALFLILNEDFPEFRKLSHDDTSLLFAILDKDGSSTITEDEFMDFSNVLLLEFTRASDYTTWVQNNFPEFFQSPRYQAFSQLIKSDRFEIAVDLIVLLNAIVIAIQSYPELSGGTVQVDPLLFDGSIDTGWEVVETLFTVTYCLEIIVKVTVFGWKAYWEKKRNVFDFTVTVLAVACTVIVYYPNEFSDSRLIRMVVMARVLRLIRLLAATPAFQLLFEVSSEILPAASSVVFQLFSLLHLFAAMGLHLFGGVITRDPENEKSYLILDTDYTDNNYWGNNFNDMVSGINVLFNLLVINNWTEMEVGIEAAQATKWVRLFFLGFHIFGVIMVNNLVIAFIINSFLEQLEIAREVTKDEVVEGEAVIRARRAIFDATEVTGTKTDLTGGYVARLRHARSDVSNKRQKEFLRKLFTRTSSAGVEEGHSVAESAG